MAVINQSRQRNISYILPYLALAGCILALSMSAVFVRWADAPAPVMGFFRIGLATIILFPVFGRQAIKSGRLPWAALVFPLLGGLFSGLDHAVWNTSLGMTMAANATLLNNMAPLWVALIAWLVFRERLRTGFWIGLALTLTGALSVLGNDFLRHPTLGWGDVLALVSSFFYAGYFLMTQLGRERLDTLSYTWFACLSSTVTLLAISLAFRMPLSGYSTQTYLAFLGAAVISQVGGYLLLAYSLGHLPASIVSPTMICQPVATAVMAIPLLGEALHPVQMIGGLAVLFGIYLVHLSRSKTAPEANPPELKAPNVVEVNQ